MASNGINVNSLQESKELTNNDFLVVGNEKRNTPTKIKKSKLGFLSKPTNPSNGDTLVYNSTSGEWEAFNDGLSKLKTKRTVLESDEILTLNTAKQLVENPETDSKVYLLEAVALFYLHNTTPYVLSGDSCIDIEVGGQTIMHFDKDLLTATFNTYGYQTAGPGASLTTQGLKQLPMYQQALPGYSTPITIRRVSNPTEGDGTLIVDVYYREVTFPTL